MAYFSNGCEGEQLERQCDHCKFGNAGAPCPAYSMQSLFNYDQIVDGKRSLASKVMNEIINEDGHCLFLKNFVEILGDETAKECWK